MSETRTENITLGCGCLLTSAGLEWCPLHKAAPALLEALEGALEWAGEDLRAEWAAQARTIIYELIFAEAKGEGHE